MLDNCNQMHGLDIFWSTASFATVQNLKVRETLVNNHHLGACAKLFCFVLFLVRDTSFQNPRKLLSRVYFLLGTLKSCNFLGTWCNQMF